jgi:hypothetical protein
VGVRVVQVGSTMGWAWVLLVHVSLMVVLAVGRQQGILTGIGATRVLVWLSNRY